MGYCANMVLLHLFVDYNYPPFVSLQFYLLLHQYKLLKWIPWVNNEKLLILLK